MTYPKEVLRLVKKRRKARHKWQSTRSPQDKAIFSKETKKLIKNINEKSFDDFIQSLDTTREANYSLWRVAKATRKHKSYVSPLKTPNGTWARSDIEKVKIFADNLQTVFQPNEVESDIETTIEQREETPIKCFSPKEVKRTIQEELDPSKAPGHDLITTRMLQEIPRKGIVMLTQIFNAILRLRHFPRDWKVAKIIMLPKPGKQLEDCKSYRPISLLPTLAKLFEKLFAKRLSEVVESAEIIPNHQFGFRGKHATIEQVH